MGWTLVSALAVQGGPWTSEAGGDPRGVVTDGFTIPASARGSRICAVLMRT
jgi:hypothetical protein